MPEVRIRIYRPPTLGRIFACAALGSMIGYLFAKAVDSLPLPWQITVLITAGAAGYAWTSWSLHDLRRREREHQRMMTEFLAALERSRKGENHDAGL